MNTPKARSSTLETHGASRHTAAAVYGTTHALGDSSRLSKLPRDTRSSRQTQTPDAQQPDTSHVSIYINSRDPAAASDNPSRHTTTAVVHSHQQQELGSSLAAAAKNLGTCAAVALERITTWQ